MEFSQLMESDDRPGVRLTAATIAGYSGTARFEIAGASSLTVSEDGVLGVNLAAASHQAGDILRATVLAFSDSVPKAFIGTVVFAARLTLVADTALADWIPPLLFNGGTLHSPGAVVLGQHCSGAGGFGRGRI